MKSLHAKMTRLAIVQEAKDFHIVEEQEQATTEAAGTVLDNFKASVSYLYQNTDLFGSAKDITVPPISQMQSVVQRRAGSLPKVYQQEYAQPLLNNFDQFLSEIDSDPTFTETICAAVYQHSSDFVAARGYLNRFQAVCATLYDDFLNNEVRKKLNLPLIEKFPPLAMFQKSGDGGPFTITSDSVQQLFGGTIGVVSLPGTYRQHPLLWSSLAHEVGGHDVLHADPGLLTELGQAVKSSIRNSDPSLGTLWQYWIDETASDVYGLLHYGPEFELNLAIFFAAINLQINGPSADWLRFTSYSGSDGQLDPHPTDILRLSVGKGALNALTNLSASSKAGYSEIIDEIINFVVSQNGGHTTITLQGFGKQTYDLKLMQSIAEQVGAVIVTTKLRALNGRSIQDITTWSQDDEKTAQTLVPILLNPNPDLSNLPPEATAQHVLSAASLAVLTNPSGAAYATMTKNVNRLLDAAFNADPLWNPKKKVAVRHLYIGESGPGIGAPSARAAVASSKTKKEPIRPFWL